jgi:protein-S-isoprenylcysteine O-methyltransferase Ste14
MNIQHYFKPATSNNWKWNLTKTLFQTSLFWGFFLVFMPFIILEIEQQFSIIQFSPLPNLGIASFILCSILGLWSGITMSIIGQGTPLPIDCPNQLVVKGPYRFVRNPMALAGIGQGVSIGWYFGSFIIILYALSGAVLWHILVRPEEEKDLAQRFGNSYLEYQQKVKCWIPRF